MKYKAVVFDLDGTLLNKKQQITERSMRTIEMLKQLGYYIIINTGRSFNACIYYSKLIDADFTISCNGAFIYDNGANKFINKLPLSKDITREVLQLLYERKEHLKIQWDSIKTYYSNNITEFETAYLENYKRDYPDDVFNIKVIKDIDTLRGFDEEIYQIFFHPLDGNKQIYFNTLYEVNEIEEVNIVDFKGGFTDINNSQANKGDSLKKLSDLLNISSDEVIAIGDGENDIPMLNYAGLSIAMENAPDYVKKRAHITTRNNEDEGVSKILEEVLQIDTKSNI